MLYPIELWVPTMVTNCFAVILLDKPASLSAAGLAGNMANGLAKHALSIILVARNPSLLVIAGRGAFRLIRCLLLGLRGVDWL